MTNIDLHSIASAINQRAGHHPIGELQKIRRDLKGLKRLPTNDIFTSLTIAEEWAFHHGGRTEIQFNIGIENVGDVEELRHGIAFSLETSQSLPNIDILVPKIRLFNEFILIYSDIFSDMRMWHYKEDGRSTDYLPSCIPPELVTEELFIFLGSRQPLANLDYELLLDCFDRLLPLYKYVESGGSLQPISDITAVPFEFSPGCTEKSSSTATTLVQRELDINLRHNILQKALFNKLVEMYREDKVGTELPSGAGTSVDVIVKNENGYWFYEIKTSQSPRACLRQALGQLLEYAFWPRSQEATRLIVVGESVLDEEATKYLSTLRERFSLPLEYEQIVV